MNSISNLTNFIKYIFKIIFARFSLFSFVFEIFINIKFDAIYFSINFFFLNWNYEKKKKKQKFTQSVTKLLATFLFHKRFPSTEPTIACPKRKKKI